MHAVLFLHQGLLHPGVFMFLGTGHTCFCAHSCKSCRAAVAAVLASYCLLLAAWQWEESLVRASLSGSSKLLLECNSSSSKRQ
jgi:hypothetical protein